MNDTQAADDAAIEGARSFRDRAIEAVRQANGDLFVSPNCVMAVDHMIRTVVRILQEIPLAAPRE